MLPARSILLDGSYVANVMRQHGPQLGDELVERDLQGLVADWQ